MVSPDRSVSQGTLKGGKFDPWKLDEVGRLSYRAIPLQFPARGRKWEPRRIWFDQLHISGETGQRLQSEKDTTVTHTAPIYRGYKFFDFPTVVFVSGAEAIGPRYPVIYGVFAHT